MGEEQQVKLMMYLAHEAVFIGALIEEDMY